MRPSVANALVLSLLLLSAAARLDALDPERRTSQYVVKTWGATSLHSSSVSAVRQTREGFLWLGTSEGLLRYDGARFVPSSAEGVPGFGDGGVSALALGGDGTLYVGTTSGIVLALRSGTLTRLWAATRADAVLSLLPARDGGLWIGIDGQSLLRFERGSAAVVGAPPTTSANALAEGPDGTIWVGRRDGLLRVAERQLTRDVATRDAVQTLAFDRAGALWLGTAHGLVRVSGDARRRLTVRDGLVDDNVVALFEDRAGSLWAGTPRGLSRFADGRFDTLGSAHGLSDDDVRCLTEDGEGTLWVGTGNGLTAVSDGELITYGRAEGLTDPRVTAVTGSLDGSIWLGTASGEVARLYQGRIESLRLPASLGRAGTVAMHVDHGGALWIAAENGRLYRLARGRLTDLTPKEVEARQQRVTYIFEDEAGLVFFVTGMALARLRDGHFVRLPEPTPALGYLHCVQRVGDTLWLGSSQGLSRLGERARLSLAPGVPRPRVRGMAQDGRGGLWLATSVGLTHFRDGRARTLSVSAGLPESHLRFVVDDGLGHLWVGGRASLFRLDGRQVDDFVAGRAERVSPVVFDTSDGLRTTEGLFGSNPAFKDAGGRLWFATAKGVSVVDPRRVATDEPAPKARIETLTVDGEPARLASYGPGRGEVTVEYGALALSGRVRFRHRLVGLDDRWIEDGARRAYYASLPPGRYRFEVMASNRYGVFGGDPASIAFVLRPPFTRTPVFFVLCAAAAAGLVLLAHRMRLEQVRSRLAAVIGERTRIAREIHDTVAQGVAGVRLQIEIAQGALADEPGAVRGHLDRAEAMARSSLAEVRRSIWVLRAQAGKGEDGLVASVRDSVRQLTAGTPIEATIDVSGKPQPLSPALERNLLRIMHEVVMNAVRHSGARRLELALRFGADVIDLDVADDGRGFDAKAHLAQSGVEHFGLLGMVERARGLGGEMHLDSRPGEGTRVSCRLPYHAAEGEGGLAQ